uniref:Uncharacterized protein n=1 Tax=Ditylenchus dipsaci TaxID=166011 RepID=A0A915DEM3_9BILA
MFTNYPTTPAGGLAVSPSTPNYVYRPPGILVPLASTPTFKMTPGADGASSPSMPPDCDCSEQDYFLEKMTLKRTIPLMQYNDSVVGSSVYHHQMPYLNTSQRGSRRWRMSGADGLSGANWCCRRFSPSKIDRCSRSGFPLLFIGFNCLYWSVMSVLSSWNTNQQDFVAFT